ncbi:hypothetical protein [Myxococcus sp. Y35]|uniref:hypothetical protein n=1 Tax=Pseudomyxococcus flavus TaxID=3115648 RepID=UPI003CF38E01
MEPKDRSPDIDKKKGELSPREAAAQEYETGQRDLRRSEGEDAPSRKEPEQEESGGEGTQKA